MECIAYRRSPTETNYGDIVTLDTRSGLLRHWDRHMKPRPRESCIWSEPTRERFQQWVSMYQKIWTLNLVEAYWVGSELELDEGL